MKRLPHFQTTFLKKLCNLSMSFPDPTQALLAHGHKTRYRVALECSWLFWLRSLFCQVSAINDGGHYSLLEKSFLLLFFINCFNSLVRVCLRSVHACVCLCVCRMHLKIYTVHLLQEEDLVREQVQRLCSLPMWICLLPVSDCGCTMSGDTVCHPVVWYRLGQILQLGRFCWRD